MNDEEVKIIASALAEIGKVLCNLADELAPAREERFKDGTLFGDETETETETEAAPEVEQQPKERKHKICFKRYFLIKFKDKNWKRYPTLNAFIEDVTQKKIGRGDRFHDLQLDTSPCSHQESVTLLKAKVIAFLKNANYPLTCQAIARDTTDDERFQA